MCCLWDVGVCECQDHLCQVSKKRRKKMVKQQPGGLGLNFDMLNLGMAAAASKWERSFEPLIY